MKNKKHIFKWLFGIAAVILIAVILLSASFAYTTKYRIADIESSFSADGRYEVRFQNVGEPNWPFGDSHGRIVLKDGGKTVTKLKFDVANDGGVLNSGNWRVSWKEDCAEVVISGEEQQDITYILYFNGRTEWFESEM